MFAWIGAAVAARGKTVCILVHRQELVDQVCAALAAMNVPHGVITAGYPATEAAVQVASVSTLARRLDAGLAPFDLIVSDEAHHAVAGSWARIMAAAPDAFSLGVTATPERLDGLGLREAFDEMVDGPSVADLTDAGFLVPARVYAPADRPDLSRVRTRLGDYEAHGLAIVMSDPEIVDEAVRRYRQHAAGCPAVAFCSSLDHSRAVADAFAGAGIPAAHIDGTTPADERRRLIAALGTGELLMLANADREGGRRLLRAARCGSEGGSDRDGAVSDLPLRQGAPGGATGRRGAGQPPQADQALHVRSRRIRSPPTACPPRRMTHDCQPDAFPKVTSQSVSTESADEPLC